MYIPYGLVYQTFSGICKEQRCIVEGREDSNALSAALRELPHLTELCLFFCQTPTQHWIRLFMDRTVESNTWRHHLPVISGALNAWRSSGNPIRTIQLSGLELPYYSSLHTYEAQNLTTCLSGVLKYAQNLRLSGSGSSLKSLREVKLPLYQLDMCSLTVDQTTLCGFLRSHESSIKYIRLHEIWLTESGFMRSDPVKISPEVYCRRLGLDWSASRWVTAPCHICGGIGWKMSRN